MKLEHFLDECVKSNIFSKEAFAMSLIGGGARGIANVGGKILGSGARFASKRPGTAAMAGIFGIGQSRMAPQANVAPDVRLAKQEAQLLPERKPGNFITAPIRNFLNPTHSIMAGNFIPDHLVKRSSVHIEDIQNSAYKYINEKYGENALLKSFFICCSPDCEENIKIAQTNPKKAFEKALDEFVVPYVLINGRKKLAEIPFDMTEDIRKNVVGMDDFDRKLTVSILNVIKQNARTVFQNRDLRNKYFLLAYEYLKKSSDSDSKKQEKKAYFIPPASGMSAAKKTILGVGLAGLGATLAKDLIIDPMQKRSLVRTLIQKDPGLADYKEFEIEDAVNTVLMHNPRLKNDKIMLAHLARQILDAPPGGLSVDFLESLSSAYQKEESAENIMPKFLTDVALRGFGLML